MPETLEDQDVPYGEDLQSPAGATAWAQAADPKRPWRADFRAHIAEKIATLPTPRVLELGSGPGALAECVLRRCAAIPSYTLLDFSEPMLAMSRERVGSFAAARLVLSDFRSDAWIADVSPPYDCVASMQAVHELRHKRHAPRLYAQVREVAAQEATILICDHTPKNQSWPASALFMTEAEQVAALASAGFTSIEVVRSEQGLVLYQCHNAA